MIEEKMKDRYCKYTGELCKHNCSECPDDENLAEEDMKDIEDN